MIFRRRPRLVRDRSFFPADHPDSPESMQAEIIERLEDEAFSYRRTIDQLHAAGDCVHVLADDCLHPHPPELGAALAGWKRIADLLGVAPDPEPRPRASRKDLQEAGLL